MATTRHGGDCRGNAGARRSRKAELLARSRTCHWCPTQLDWGTLQQDRIIPGTLGGRYDLENLVGCCGPCNKVKSDKVWFCMDPACRPCTQGLMALAVIVEEWLA